MPIYQIQESQEKKVGLRLIADRRRVFLCAYYDGRGQSLLELSVDGIAILPKIDTEWAKKAGIMLDSKGLLKTVDGQG